MEYNLREELRSRVQNILPRMDLLPRRRVAVLVWKKTDGPAARLCGAVSPFSELYRPCPLGDRQEQSLRACLETLAEERRDGAIVCPDGLYLLWVWSEERPDGLEALTANFRERLPIRADQCFLTADTACCSNRQGRLWLVDPGVPSAADALAALLLTGSLNVGLVSGNLQAPVRFETTLHSAVERDLARQLRDKLEALTEGDPAAEKERFRKEFGPTKQDLETLMGRVPLLQNLPVIGGKTLTECLRPEEGLLRRMARVFRGEQDSGKTISVRDALEGLFGRPEGRAPHEWLLERVLPVLPKLCREYFSRLELEQRSFRQPLWLLTREATGLALHFQEQAREAQNQQKIQLDEALGRNLKPRGAHPAQLLSAAEQELKPWENCVRSALEASWWGCVSDFFGANSDLVRQAREKQEDLIRALTILGSMELGPRREPADLPGDWRQETPLTLLNGLYSRAEFTDEDAALLVESARRRAEKSFRASGLEETVLLWDGDNMGMLKESKSSIGRPLFEDRNGVLTVRSTTGNVRVLPVQGLGRQIMWELRMSICAEQPDIVSQQSGEEGWTWR